MPDKQQQNWGGWDAHIRDQLKVLEERREHLEEELDALNEDISEGQSFLGEGDDSDDMPPKPSSASKQRDAQAAVTQHQSQQKAKPKR